MYMNPYQMDHLAQDRQRQMLCEAEEERLSRQATMGQPSLLLRLRLRASELLARMGRGSEPRTPGKREQTGALSHANRRGPASARFV